MSDLADLGIICIVCLGITALFRLRGTAINATAGRTAAAKNVLLAIIIGIYLYNHAIAVLGVALVVLGYAAILSESNDSTTETAARSAKKVRGISTRTTTQRTTVKKSPLRKNLTRKTPVRRATQESFQPATRFSVPPTIFDAPPRREPVFTQKDRENYEAFKRELEEQYGPLIEGPIPRRYRSGSGSE